MIANIQYIKFNIINRYYVKEFDDYKDRKIQYIYIVMMIKCLIF